MVIELRKAILSFTQQQAMKVMYSGEVVGNYIADILVADSVIVEIKAVQRLERIHMAQCLNYLKALNLRIGLLINFGAPSVEIKRIVNGL